MPFFWGGGGGIGQHDAHQGLGCLKTSPWCVAAADIRRQTMTNAGNGARELGKGGAPEEWRAQPEVLYVVESGGARNNSDPVRTICYAIVLPGQKSIFRARFKLDPTRNTSKSGLRPAFGRPENRL